MTGLPISRRLLCALVALQTVLVPLACSSESSDSAADSSGSTPDSSGSQPSGDAPTPGSTPETFTADVTGGPGAGTFDTTAGLADLTSYSATLAVSFTGTNAGNPSEWSTMSEMLVTTEPVARALSITRTGDLPDPISSFTAEANGAVWDKRGDESCVADVAGADDERAALTDMAASLSFVLGADAAGSETVNGISADDYTFDERAILQSGLTTSTGEIWIATTGGYVVKYLLTSEAGEDFFGEGIEGTITLDYELVSVNQPVTLQFPADCPVGIIDAPQLPDATNVESLPGRLTYDTATATEDIIVFYQSELAARGWVPSEEAFVADDGGALMEFTQGDLTLVLTVSIHDVGASVELLVIPTETG